MEDICSTMAKIIRDRSESGRLIKSDEVASELQGRGLFRSEEVDGTIDFEAIAARVLEENQDLRRIYTREETPFYYSVQSLTETYAHILLWKSDHPLWLMAQVVRDNSQRYQRPITADSFRAPPFELTQEEIAECLKSLGAEGEYQDIAQTTTTLGALFLYSTRHLDPDHASTLAEWLDAGQPNNP